MKIDKLNRCVTSILLIFHDLMIYNGKSNIVVFLHKLNITAEKSHAKVTTDEQT